MPENIFFEGCKYGLHQYLPHAQQHLVPLCERSLTLEQYTNPTALHFQFICTLCTVKLYSCTLTVEYSCQTVHISIGDRVGYRGQHPGHFGQKKRRLSGKKGG